MEKETRELIQDLAKELGVRADHLWEVMIKQQVIEGTLSGFSPLLILIPFITFLVLRSIWKKYDEDSQYIKWFDYKVSVIISGAISAIVFMITIGVLIKGLMMLNNPEYYALEEILRKI